MSEEIKTTDAVQEEMPSEVLLDAGKKEGRGQRMPRFKKKVCRFCYDKNAVIDYKKPDVLERFLTDRGKILPRRITGTCAKHQRVIAREVKKARVIALLPFVEL